MRNGPWDKAAQRLARDTPDGIGRRSRRLRDLLGKCLGPHRPPDLEALDGPRERFDHPYLRVAHSVRAELAEIGKEVIDGLLAQEIERVAPHLAPSITVLWPDGSLAHHPKEELLDQLQSQGGRALPVLVRDIRTYLPGEWRAALPRGYADLLAATTGEGSAVAITAELGGRRGSQGRVVVFAASDLDSGDWQVLNLPLPSPDDGAAQSTRISLAEDEAVRVAERAVRYWSLGLRTRLRAMRNQMMRMVWLGAELVTAEELRDRAWDVDPDEGSWRIFAKPEHDSKLDPSEFLTAETMRQLERKSHEAWRTPWDRLVPRWIRIPLSEIDPATLEVRPSPPAYALCLQQTDRDQMEVERLRWRLAGLFVP